MADVQSTLRTANALIAQGRLDEAQMAVDAALRATPADHAAHCLMCFLLTKRGEHERAIGHIRRALAAVPDEPNYLANLGKLQFLNGATDEAEATLRQVLELAPGNLNAHIDLANLLEGRHRYAAAAEQCRHGLAFFREHPLLANNEGVALLNLGRVEEAVARLRRAAAANPVDLGVLSTLAGAMNYLPDADPVETAERHRAYGRLLRHYLPERLPMVDGGKDPERVLRVGLVSPDFRGHSVACFVEPLLAGLDRAEFQVVCYMTSTKADATTARLKGLVGAAGWRDAANLGEIELAEMIRNDRIDVLIDLAGHTRGQRLAAFHLRPAPVQVTYCGYPNTTGVEGIDLRIVDGITDPPSADDEARPGTEELLRMPECFLCYRPPEAGDMPDVGPPPVTTTGYITFGSFNALQKTNGRVIEVWSELLRRVPGSRLLLKNPSLSEEETRGAVRDRFAACGISADRLELLGWSASTREHLAEYNRVDVALDTFPYAGATTTCEALLMGVPVVTLSGHTHAGRVGMSLLLNAGLPGWVADSMDAYLSIAETLAGGGGSLVADRPSLRARFLASPVCDQRGFAARFWRAIRRGWSRHCAGELRTVAAAEAPHEDAPPMASPTPAAAGAMREAMGLLQAGDDAKARMVLEQASRRFPRDVGLADMLATVLLRAGEGARAVYAAEQGLRAAPEDPGLLHTHGLALAATTQGDKAVATLKRAVERAPNWVEPRAALAGLYNQRALFASAAELVAPIVAREPGNIDAALTYASALVNMGRVEEALGVLRAARERNPGNFRLAEMWAFMLNYDPGATAEDQHAAHVEFGVALERIVPPPHPPTPPNTSTASAAVGTLGRPLRIGFLSADLRAHAVASFVEPIAVHLNRTEFELTMYYTGAVEDAASQRLKSLAAAWWHETRPDPAHVAQQVRRDRIDILIDLAGLTAQHRLAVMAMRPAPVQATFLGYPNTTGMERIDYRIVDARTDPAPDADALATERLARLDRCFLCYSPPRVEDRPDVPPRPPCAQNGHVTFGSLGSLLKVNRQVVAAWAQLLHTVPGSRLLIKNHGTQEERVRTGLRGRFAEVGIESSRVEIVPPQLGGVDGGSRAHLETYNRIDLALDTFPYAGTTTTCEALLMGVPVVTLEGPVHAGRVGASLLAAVGLGDMIARNQAGYVPLAARLGTDTARLAELRATLRDRLLGSPLCDGAAYAASFGSILRRMWTERRGPA